jgi:FkbM family methyltransferase
LNCFGLRLERNVKKNDKAEPAPNYRNFMPTCFDRLQHARHLGFSPRAIVDGGAFIGEFTREAATLFPGARFIVVEPNPFVQQSLRQNTHHIAPAPIYCECALGERAGKTAFNIWGDPTKAVGASLLAHVQGAAEHSVEVMIETVDGLAAKYAIKPDLIKLDLQGAEALALRGSPEALRTAEMLVVEFGCLEAYTGRATPREIMEIVYSMDYCLYDVVDCHYRPYDGALTAGDFIFVKRGSALKKYKGWE